MFPWSELSYGSTQSISQMEFIVSTSGASPLLAWSYEIHFFSPQTLPVSPPFQTLQHDNACVISVFKNKADQEWAEVPVPTQDGLDVSLPRGILCPQTSTVRTGEYAAGDNSEITFCHLFKCWRLNLPLGGLL